MKVISMKFVKLDHIEEETDIPEKSNEGSVPSVYVISHQATEKWSISPLHTLLILGKTFMSTTMYIMTVALCSSLKETILPLFCSVFFKKLFLNKKEKITTV